MYSCVISIICEAIVYSKFRKRLIIDQKDEEMIMNHVNQKIIDAVIAKAEKVCPDSLALIGVYGSVCTGDEYEKSDLDLLILIQDEEGWKLGTGFILNDSKVGYDYALSRNLFQTWCEKNL